MKLIKILFVGVMLSVGALVAKAQPGGMGQFDPAQMIEMRVNHMKEAFKLTDAQVPKVKAVFQKQQDEMGKLMQGGGQPDFSAFQKLQDDANAELKKILTADQYKAYTEEMENMRRGMGGPGGPGGQGGPRPGGQGGPRPGGQRPR